MCALAMFFCTLIAPRLQAEDDVAEGLEAVNKRIQASPEDGRLLVERSRLLIMAQNFDQALADLDQANRLTPLPEIDREKAQVYLAAGWYETGLEHANRHLARFADDVDGYLVRARLNARLGRTGEAGADFGSVLERMKKPTLGLYLERAQVLATQDGAYLNEALNTINQGIKNLGPVVTLENAALEIEMRQGRYDAAIARVDEVTERMPRKDTWLARRGDILVQAGRLAEARRAYQQALDAINKLTPSQRAQLATKELEKQLKDLLEASMDLAGRPAVTQPTRLLAAVPTERSVVPALRPASTNTPALPPDGQTRTYYIAAEEIEWDYAPGGNVLQETFCGDPDSMPGNADGRIGTRYHKSLYREYTDDSFERLKLRSAHWRHLGLLGPLLRAEVGDRIHIVFRNKTRFPASLHPHGVFYLKTGEGSGYNDSTAPADKKDDAVPSGQSFTYEWIVPERAGPGPGDGSSLVWLYHSHVHAAKDSNAGLIGAIIVTAKGKARPDGTPVDVDREFVTLFNIFDENASWYFETNLKTYLRSTNAVVGTNLPFHDSNLKHAINGYLFANLPLMTMNQGERVRWYLLGMGSETDLHTPHWHGNTVVCHGYRTDVVELLPASMKVADMVPDNPGTWMFHCHVNDHMIEGMSALYQVLTK